MADGWSGAQPLLDALADYARARSGLLAQLGRTASCRDPLAEVSELLVCSLLPATVVAAQRGEDPHLVTAGGERVQVRHLATPADAPWESEHLVEFRSGGAELYALVTYEGLAPRAVLVFSRRTLAAVRERLGGRREEREATLRLTERDYRQLLGQREAFAALGVAVHVPPGRPPAAVEEPGALRSDAAPALAASTDAASTDAASTEATSTDARSSAVPVPRRVAVLEAKESLRPDCARCAALCCVALSFGASSEFAADKASGVACPNLVEGLDCGIHEELRARGYRGCALFDCFGAGQLVTSRTCAGVRWQEGGAGAARLFAVFDVMRRLKELAWYLADAADAATAGPLAGAIGEMRQRVQALVGEDAAHLERLDVLALQERVHELLAAASGARRGELASCSGLALAGGDLRNADFTHTNLRGADLRYAQLSPAVLVGADLEGADLLGADLRDADVRGARLAGSLYLTQSQVESADGDDATTLPAAIRRPAHWRRQAIGRVRPRAAGGGRAPAAAGARVEPSESRSGTDDDPTGYPTS